MPPGSTFVQTLVAPSHPGPTSGTPALVVEVGGTSDTSVFLRTAAAWGQSRGDAPECVLSGHFLPSWGWGYLEDPIPGGAESTAASPFPMLGNASHPFHPTPGQLPPFRVRAGGRWGKKGKARVGNVVVWITLQGLDPAPCSEDSGPSRKVQAFQKFLTPPSMTTSPPPPSPALLQAP